VSLTRPAGCKALENDPQCCGSFFYLGRQECGPCFATKEIVMIKVGDALPAVTLMEYVEVEGNGCSLGPNPVKLPEALAGKTIAVFAVPGAFTPTCSEKHLPGYVAKAEE